MDCPICGGNFIYNGSEVFCGTFDCHTFGSECQQDFEDYYADRDVTADCSGRIVARGDATPVLLFSE